MKRMACQHKDSPWINGSTRERAEPSRADLAIGRLAVIPVAVFANAVCSPLLCSVQGPHNTRPKIDANANTD